MKLLEKFPMEFLDGSPNNYLEESLKESQEKLLLKFLKERLMESLDKFLKKYLKKSPMIPMKSSPRNLCRYYKKILK